MELEVLGTRGIPQSGLISVSAAGVRKQIRLSGDGPIKFSGKPDDMAQIKVDVLDVLGRARMPYQENTEEKKYTLPLYSASDTSANAPGNMEVDIIVRPSDSEPSSSGKDDESRRRREADANDYLGQHGLVNFMQFLLHSLMEDKPADPYPFLQKQIALQMASGGRPSTSMGGFASYSERPLFEVPSLKESEQEVTSLLENLSPTSASKMKKGDIAALEREAEEARKRLIEDNEALRDAAMQMGLEYEKLMRESKLLNEHLAAKKAGKPSAPNAVEEGYGEADTQKTVDTYMEIEKLQQEVKQLARENAALVSKLARGREMINSVRQDIVKIQQETS